MIRRTIGVAALTLCVGVFAGCATTSNPVSILYSPSVEARGGSGTLFLKVSNGSASGSKSDSMRWVIGKQKNADGEVKGEIVSVSSEQDMMLDALKRELTAAGYRVETGSSLPQGVGKGLDLTAIRVAVEEIVGIPKTEATGKVQVSMDVWKNGVVARRLSYESKASDFAAINRERLPRDMIEQGLREVLGQAVPEIISVLEQK